ncbi:hypothetical protein [Halomonas sp. DQ26W]|uniref:hypothetical protein n=1 Tax=Halomonas sp. DQ26W TaxID=2282311 RepID=UPI0011C039BC|nr:hypothetical protein [Halomonas sp. DQ26W]
MANTSLQRLWLQCLVINRQTPFSKGQGACLRKRDPRIPVWTAMDEIARRYFNVYQASLFQQHCICAWRTDATLTETFFYAKILLISKI